MTKYHNIMLKTHNTTKLKYLCYHYGTTDSCHKYNGSGLIWKRHLKVHGNDLNSEILIQSENHEEVKKFAIDISNKYDIVKSKEFANLIVETADSTGMHDPEIIKKARFNQRMAFLVRGGMTEKQKDGHKRRAEKMSKKLKGISMKEKYGDDWVSPCKGISMKEKYGDDWVFWQKGITKKKIYGDDWVNPRKGRTNIEQFGEDYRSPKNLPIEIEVNGITESFDSIKSLYKAKGLNSNLVFKALRGDGTMIITTRYKSTKHQYPINTVLKFKRK